MTGVNYSKYTNPEEGGKLGFDVVAWWSFFLGVSYPLPHWYSKLSSAQKFFWRVYCHIGDVFTFLLFVSNLGGIIIAYHDIRAFVTCIGTMTYIVCFRIKLLIYKKKSKTLEKLIGFLCKISLELEENPVEDKNFFPIYRKYFKIVMFLGKGKLGMILGSVTLMAVVEGSMAFLEETDEKRELPMFGWYPYDPHPLNNYLITVFFQYISYSSFLLKDVFLDTFCMTILVIINTQLIYLRTLLELSLNDKNEIKTEFFDSKRKKEILRWWIIHHQMVLKAIEDLKKITNLYFLYKFVSVIIILFFGGVLVTTEKEYDLVQQMIVLAINSSNLFQLYFFSVVGNEITENGLRLTEFGFHGDLIYNRYFLGRPYTFITARCSKSIFLYFGKINPLSVASFAKIVKVTFSYFLTIVQIRGNANENISNDALFYNATSN